MEHFAPSLELLGAFVGTLKKKSFPRWAQLCSFLGEVNLKDHYGEKPMSIKWELNEPMPHYIWKESAKMAVG